MRKLIALLVAGGLMWSVLGAAQAGPPVTVIGDAKGDAGHHLSDQSIPAANEQGMDIVGGTIARVKRDLVFTVVHGQMPADGPPKEIVRLLYHFNIDNPADTDGAVEWRFTVKRYDIGKPDLIARTGTERIGQVYDGVARLEQCTPDPVVSNLIQCTPSEYFGAKFDAATKSASWTVPMAKVGAVTGSIIGPGTGGAADTDCVLCWVPQWAERSLTPTSIIDSATFVATYTVPKK